ncbi:aspartate kinase [Porphyromonas pogonae]|uniref:aspartate kinase n=1 Tax=Porphyromonas pogonae TaxID=867595 RepID=UPI002E7A8926|nr:aspartate kinase [Porphyromonas pogonae]
MRVLKFGGKSLDNGVGLHKVLGIILDNYNQGKQPTIIVSARGDATDRLLHLVDLAVSDRAYEDELDSFITHQQAESTVDLCAEFDRIEDLLRGIRLLHECSSKTKDEIVSFGEIISSKFITHELIQKGYPAIAVDAGDLIITNSNYGNADVDIKASELQTISFFESLSVHLIPIITGFIARSHAGNRTTLGRNGSNYTAALVANFLNASILENYTHVDGIYTANPSVVKDAKKIEELSYSDAAELSQFGADILHIKTIEPLQRKDIPLRVLNTFVCATTNTGTLISSRPQDRSVRALASLSHKALIHFEGKNMLGRAGIDARIFGAFGKRKISASLVSQGSSERGIAIVVNESDADNAVKSLAEEFLEDIRQGLISVIYAEKGLSVLAIVGLNLAEFDRPYKALVTNQIIPILLNNAIPGNTLCLLVRSEEISKAMNVIHGEIFDRTKAVHLAVIGHGAVGKEFIDQVLAQRSLIRKRKNIDLKIFAVANSQKLLLSEDGIGYDWSTQKERMPPTSDIAGSIIDFGKKHYLENMIVIDNTASPEIAIQYETFASNGFDIVSSNKRANTLPWIEYQALRTVLKNKRKTYRYETNVGAGLPLIDNLKLLHLAGERITRIYGLFSGSLSFIFNSLSENKNLSVREALQESIHRGYTEPDPREDLSGNDVARKVLILVRELDVPCELCDVDVENLVPKALRSLTAIEFQERFAEFEQFIEAFRNSCSDEEVMRYVGEVVWDDNTQQALLKAGLRKIPRDSPLGMVRGADSCFEIYTESYGSSPIVIQGAGAGAKVTARGVFGDVLRLAERYQ